MPSPLDKYRRRYLGGGGSPLDRYRQRYGFSTGAPRVDPVVAEPSLAAELWRRAKTVGGGILSSTSAGVGALGGLGAAALGSDVYERTLRRKAQEAALDDGGDVFENLELAPKVGELLTEGWQPESAGGRAIKNVASLGATLATDPASYLTGGGARGLGLAATALYGPETARGAYEGLKGAVGSVGEGNYVDAAGQAVEGVLLSGLAALMAKGVITEAQALRATARARGEKPPAPATPPASFFDEETPSTVAPQTVPSVFQEAPPEASTPRRRVFVGQEAGPPTPVETRRRTFYAGPEGTVVKAPQVALGEVPRVFAEEGLPTGDVPPEVVGPFGEPPLEEYLPPVFRQETPAEPVLERARVPRRKASKLKEVPRVEAPPGEPVVESLPPTEVPPTPPEGGVSPAEAVAGLAPEKRVAQLQEWIDGIDQALADDGENPGLQSLRAEMVAERERLSAPPKKAELRGLEDVPPVGTEPGFPAEGEIPEAPPGEASTPEPSSKGPDPELVARRSREGYSARELAAELGVNEEEIRIIRKEQGVSNADVVEGRKVRFAPKEPTRGAPSPAKGAPGEAPAPAAGRDPLAIAQEFLAGKETVQEGEIREALKSRGVASLDIKETLRRLDNLGIITKTGGKTRRVRPSAESVPELPAEAAATAETAASQAAAPEEPGVSATPTPIPIAGLEVGGVYRLTQRNLEKAVYLGDGKFTGVREKGAARYLDTEYHAELGAPYGTAIPVEKIGQVPKGMRLDKGERIPTGKPGQFAVSNKPLFDYLEGRAPEATPPVEPPPLTVEQQARQDLYIDPATGEIRPEIDRQVKAAAKKFTGFRSRGFDEIYSEMKSHLPEVVGSFDPEKGSLTQHVYKQMQYGERHRWESAQREPVVQAEDITAKGAEGQPSVAEKLGAPPNQETGPAAARKEFAHVALQRALAKLPAEDLALVSKLKEFGGDLSGEQLAKEAGVSRETIRNRKNNVLGLLKDELEAQGVTGAEGHTPDSATPDGWQVAAAEVAGQVHPIEGAEGLIFVDTPNLPEGHAREMAAAPETRKLATTLRRLYDDIQIGIGTPGRSRFSGFMAGTNALGVHIGDKATRVDGRVFVNLVRHAEAAAAHPVKSLRMQEMASSTVDTLVHEALHNTYPHGPEMAAAEVATLDRMLRDGSYARATNALKQTLSAHDGYLMKWLEDRAAFGEKNYGKPEAAPADVRRAGAGRAAPGPDRPGAGAAEAAVGTGSGAPTTGGVSGGAAREALQLGPGAPVRGGGAGADRIPSGDQLRVEARLDDDVAVRAARDAFTEKTLKDIDPRRLMSLMPDISAKITPEVFSEIIDAADTIGPPALKAKPGGAPDTALNILRVVGDDDLKTKLLAMDQVLGKHNLFDRNTPQHWATADELLEALGDYKSNKELVEHIKRYGATPREMTLLRMLHVFQGAKTRQANDAFKVAARQLEEAAAKGGATVEQIATAQRAAQEKFIQHAQQAQLSLDLSGQKTKVARVLASMRQTVDDLDPYLVNFSQHQRFLKALEIQGVSKDVRNKLHQLLVSNDPKAYDEFTTLFRESMRYSTTEKLMEAYVAGLVSGIPTKIANFNSNALFRGLRDAENLLSVGVDTARAAITGTPRERFLGEAAAGWAGYKHHVADALKDWVSAHGEIATLKPLSVRGLRFISGTPLDEAFRSGGKIPGKVGELLRYGFKSMEVDDGLFKHLAGAQELWRRLYREGRIAGLDHEQALAAVEPRVKEIQASYETGDIKSLGKDTIAMLKSVNAQVLSDTFQSPLEGLLAKIQLVSNHHPLTKLLVPFIKTPSNIFIQTWKRTPLGLLQTIANKGKYTQGQWAEELSKGLLGTTIAGGIAAMAYEWANDPSGQHQITGSGPLDPKLTAQLKATGWQPYSFKVGDRYIPFTRAEPLSSILGIAADMAWAVKNGETHSVSKFGERLIKSVTTNLANKTFISGLTAAAQAWSEPDRFMERFIAQLESGVVPLSGLVRTVTRATDPYYRETGFADTKFGVAAPILANVPGASQLLPVQYSPSGEPRTRPGGAIERAVSPIPTTVEDRSPKGDVLRLLTEVGYAPVVRDYYESRKYGRVQLTDDEKALLNAAHARANRALEKVVRDPTFLALPDSTDDPEAFGGRKTKEDVIRSIHNRHYQAALKSIFPEIAKRAIDQRRRPSA